LFRLFCIALMICIFSSAFSYPAIAGNRSVNEQLPEDVPRISNPADARYPPLTFKPTELWRLGGESENDYELFGRVSAIKLADNGDSYVLDMQLNRITVFDTNGQYLRTLGRSGEGPGEFYLPNDLFFLSDNRICASSVMGSRLPIIDRSTGNAASDFRLPEGKDGRVHFIHQMDTRDSLIIVSYIMALNRDGKDVNIRTLASCHEGDEQLTTMHEDVLVLSEARSDPEHVGINYYSNWDLGPDGNIYVAPYYMEYKIVCLRPDGSIARIIERDYETRKRTRSELKDLKARDAARFGGNTSGLRDPDPYDRDINGLFCFSDGSFWVSTSRGALDKAKSGQLCIDAFSREGRFERELTLEIDYDADFDELMVSGDRLFVLKEAKSTPDATMTTASGLTIMLGADNPPPAEDRDPEPFEIICYSFDLSN
jgi:6-bladed beta-propeller